MTDNLGHELRRVVVVGPPNAGKTSYVQRSARDGDFVWDFDHASFLFFRLLTFPRPPYAIDLLEQLNARAVQWLAAQPRVSCWLITTDRARAELWRESLGAVVVDLTPT